jgi:hypothetical protein
MASGISIKTNNPLTQQLQAAEAKGSPVQAWFRLKDPMKSMLSPEQTETLAHQIVNRAKSRLGENVDAVNVQRQLGTFTVLAHPSLVKEIWDQPEIDAAGATQVPDFGLIRPVKIVRPESQIQQRKKRRAK